MFPFWQTKAFKIALSSVLALSGLILFYTLADSGPDSVEYTYEAPTADLSEGGEFITASTPEALHQLSQNLEAAFLASQDTDPTHAIELLDNAIEAQEQLIRSTPYDRATTLRLKQLETLKQNFLAAPVLANSLDLEAMALSAIEEEKFDLANRYLDATIELQEEINHHYPQSSARNTARIVELKNRKRELETIPLKMRSIESEEAALAAIQAGKLPAATKHYFDAIETQQKLNANFPKSKQADAKRLVSLQAALDTLNAQDLKLELEAALQRAERFANEQQAEGQITNLEQALEIAQAAITQYPLNTLISRADLESLRNTLKEAETLQNELALSKELRALDEALRAQNFQAVSRKLSDIEKIPAQATEQAEKIRFLSQHIDKLPKIHADLSTQFLPIPGSPDKLLATEVTQALYQDITEHNPSRHIGEKLPVESILWSEANQFCKKLGWLLGRPVRLPLKEDFIPSLGTLLEEANLDTFAWTHANSLNETHPVASRQPNEYGFYDLLGNVDEWLGELDTAQNSEALIAGGSIFDSAQNIIEAPIRTNPLRQRSRAVGFRVVLPALES